MFRGFSVIFQVLVIQREKVIHRQMEIVFYGWLLGDLRPVLGGVMLPYGYCTTIDGYAKFWKPSMCSGSKSFPGSLQGEYFVAPFR